MLKIGHTVTVPGSLKGSTTDSEPDSIPIPEELETVPGHPQDPDTVNYYTRNYPLESENLINYAWISWSIKNGDMNEAFHDHLRQDRPIVVAARASGDVEPQVAPVPGKDVSQEIKQKALELGFEMVGISAYDNRYTFKHKRSWVKPYPNAICLAVEQPYEQTQMIPSEDSEVAVLATYRRGGSQALKLAEYINTLGYHAQVHNFTDAAAAIIPMFVAAGMGQQGAMGYLLSPHFGSRHRLTLVTTDALVTHDQPVDYGINSFCEICQVCVNRCPGRALMRDKIWWRGVEKFKIVAKRCRPVMSRYTQCAICMKVLPCAAVRPEDGDGPLRYHRPGVGQGNRRAGRLRTARPGLLRPRRAAQVRHRLLHRPCGYRRGIAAGGAEGEDPVGQRTRRPRGRQDIPGVPA